MTKRITIFLAVGIILFDIACAMQFSKPLRKDLRQAHYIALKKVRAQEALSAKLRHDKPMLSGSMHSASGTQQFIASLLIFSLIINSVQSSCYPAEICGVNKSMELTCPKKECVEQIRYSSTTTPIRSAPAIICTAALLDRQYEMRKQEYIKGIEKIKQFGFTPYIVESCKNGPTFLDSLSAKVWYAKTNDANLKNKGVNEARAMLDFFDHTNFSDDDMIVKITGRYLFLDENFLNYLAGHPTCDAVVKFGFAPDRYDKAIYTACFAMKYKHCIKFLRQLNLQKMETQMIDIEHELAEYVDRHKDMTVCDLDTLGIASRVAFNNYTDYL